MTTQPLACFGDVCHPPTHVPTSSLAPEAYPCSSAVPTRRADLDLLDHINNVSMVGLFEEGRGKFNRALQQGKCVATCHTTIVYTDATGPVPFPETFRTQMERNRVKT